MPVVPEPSLFACRTRALTAKVGDTSSSWFGSGSRFGQRPRPCTTDLGNPVSGSTAAGPSSHDARSLARVDSIPSARTVDMVRNARAASLRIGGRQGLEHASAHSKSLVAGSSKKASIRLRRSSVARRASSLAQQVLFSRLEVLGKSSREYVADDCQLTRENDNDVVAQSVWVPPPGSLDGINQSAARASSALALRISAAHLIREFALHRPWCHKCAGQTSVGRRTRRTPGVLASPKRCGPKGS